MCKIKAKDEVHVKWYESILKKTTRFWLEEQRKKDDLDGLWRIHDNLYDVTNFINKHPGGRFWLEETKGMDITEAFESHHIKSDAPEEILKKYFVKKATKPRLSQYTFDENGFYKTLKRKVRVALQTLPKDCHKMTDMYTDALLVLTFVFACLANAFSMYIFVLLAAVFGSFLLVANHNYTHQRDNFRMWYGELLMSSVRQFRIVHVLSHHAFCNLKYDLQLTFLLPAINFFPEKKSFTVKYLSGIISTVLVFPLFLHITGIFQILEILSLKDGYKKLLLPFILPALMYFTSNGSMWETFVTWQLFLLFTGTLSSTIAYTTTHIHPDLFVEGDTMRPKEELDWGISQLDAIYDRKELRGNLFLNLVMFGDHALHHMFPTLDQGYLEHLYPVLEETLKEFNMKNINLTTTPDMYLGYFRQTAREVPKITPPFL